MQAIKKHFSGLGGSVTLPPFWAWREMLLTLAVDESIANWPLSQPTQRLASYLRSLWEILLVPAPFDLSLWALMRSIKTGHLLYVPLCPISKQMMLASLKLKPEVDISELIAEHKRCYSRTTYWSWDVEYAKHLSDRGALKISNITSPEYREWISKYHSEGTEWNERCWIAVTKHLIIWSFAFFFPGNYHVK